MEKLFEAVLSMSLTASVIILLILLARLALRKAPKMFSYALWAVVLLRLLCPFTIESAFSLAPSVQVKSREWTDNLVAVDVSQRKVTIAVGDAPVSNPELPVSHAPAAPAVPDPAQPEAPAAAMPAAPGPWSIAGAMWLAGTALLLGYSALSLLKLRRRLVGSVPLMGEKNVRLADHIPSPFVLGLFRPEIYLPSDLPEGERDYILLHERTHIRRFDHVTRALAWIALSVHWFNPLVWLSFHLAGKDMEMSCDEAVLRKMGRDVRADYSTSLLRLSVGGKLPAGPLAFGGGDPQNRIKNVLRYKKPALWVVVIALIGVLCAGVALATDQSSPLIDPDSVVSVTAFDAASRTITEQNTGVYTTADLRKDLLDPVNPQVLSQEDGIELVRLINSHRKTVFGHGELTLTGWEHHLKRIDCADGSFYVVDYWYWNGFSFNPLHMGEDDFTTLVTYFDAEGNLGTTWQMEYGFDHAYRDWRSGLTPPPAAPEQGGEDAPEGGALQTPSDDPFVLTALGLSYSLEEAGRGVYINNLDCAGALWQNQEVPLDPRVYQRETAALGTLSITNPRFLGGYFANAYGNAVALYYPEESSPTLVMGFADYTKSVTDLPDHISFVVDLGTKQVKSLDISGYAAEAPAPEFSDEKLLVMAGTLAGIIEGAAKSWETLSNPPAEEGPLPFDHPMALWFESGAGAWRTILTLHPDGSFEGKYNDADLGVFGEEYPMGTEYVCTFHGKFGDIKQVSAASWSMTLEELTLDTGHPIDEEWISERTRYISSAPYGLTGENGPLEPGAQFVFYTPKAGEELYGMENKSSGLYEFWTWWPERHPFSGGTLGCYALRNVETGYGFFDLSAWGLAPEQPRDY